MQGLPRYIGFIRRFRSANTGIAALEFAFIAPVFVFILLTVISLYAQGTAQREVQQTTASVSDLAARYVYLDDSRVAALGAATEALLQSTPSVKNIRLAIASFSNPLGVADFDYTTQWSKTYNGATAITDEEVQSVLGANATAGLHFLNNTTDTMLFLRVEADYVSPYGLAGMTNEITMVRKAWVMPRYASAIEFRESENGA